MAARPSALLSRQQQFQAQPFAGDVSNAVLEYCADGIDAFEKCLEGAPLLEPEVIHSIRMGVEQLGHDLVNRMEPNLAMFERLCTMAVFQVPDSPPLIQAAAPMASPMRTPMKSEAELDMQLHGLRTQLQQAVQERSELQTDVARLDNELRQHGHLAAHTAALSGALHMHSGAAAAAAAAAAGGAQGAAAGSRLGEAGAAGAAQDIAASIAAIAAGVSKLQPLLQKAQKLRSQRPPASAMSVDAAVAVEVKSSQLTKACGTLQDLQALRGLLDPAVQQLAL